MFEENSLIGKIAKGEYPEKSIKTKYGVFIVKYPSGLDFQVIARKTAACYGGLPIASYTPDVIAANEINNTLSAVIETYPKDFPDQWEKDGIVDFPDWEVKNALYEAFNTFYSGTQKKISGKPGGKSTAK